MDWDGNVLKLPPELTSVEREPAIGVIQARTGRARSAARSYLEHVGARAVNLAAAGNAPWVVLGTCPLQSLRDVLQAIRIRGGEPTAILVEPGTKVRMLEHAGAPVIVAADGTVRPEVVNIPLVVDGLPVVPFPNLLPGCALIVEAVVVLPESTAVQMS